MSGIKRGHLNIWLNVAREEKLGRAPSRKVQCLKPEEQKVCKKHGHKRHFKPNAVGKYIKDLIRSLTMDFSFFFSFKIPSHQSSITSTSPSPIFCLLYYLCMPFFSSPNIFYSFSFFSQETFISLF